LSEVFWPHGRLAAMANEVVDVAKLHAMKHHNTTTLPHEAMAETVASNLHAIGIPTGLRGSLNATPQELVEYFRALGRGDGSHGLIETMMTMALNNLKHPNVGPTTRDRIIDLVQEGQRFCVLISEPGTSSALPGTIAPTLSAKQLSDGNYALNGKKTAATGIQGCSHAMVYAHIDGTPPNAYAVFMVPTTHKGVVIDTKHWDPVGMRATCSYGVTFDGVVLDPDMLVFASDNFIVDAIYTEPLAAWGYMTSVYLGVAEALFTDIIQLLKKRDVKGGQPLSANFAREVGGCAAQLSAAYASLMAATDVYATSEPGAAVAQAFLTAKAVMSETANQLLSLKDIWALTGSQWSGAWANIPLRAANLQFAAIQPPSLPACYDMLGLGALGLLPPA